MGDWSGRPKDAAGTLTGDFDRLQDDFDRLRARLVRMADDTVREFNSSPHNFSGLKDVIESRLAAIEDDIGGLGERLRLQGGEAAGRVEQQVRDHPLASLAVAFGVGLIAARLLRRRRAP
ncbi:MAG TPA: hypothetical protein VF286_10320 [Acidiphilium sp.]